MVREALLDSSDMRALRQERLMREDGLDETLVDSLGSNPRVDDEEERTDFFLLLPVLLLLLFGEATDSSGSRPA